MLYRKWLNIVIYLISAMIILLLIMQKSINKRQNKTAPVDQKTIQLRLLPNDFEFESIAINQHPFDFKELQKDLNSPTSEQIISNWIQAWKNEFVVEVKSRQTRSERFSKKVEWQEKFQKHAFILYYKSRNRNNWILEDENNHQFYQFSASQLEELFPIWFESILFRETK